VDAFTAKDIVKMLLAECDMPNIEQRYQCDVHSIEKIDEGFRLHAGTEIVECESLVIATGGLSMPKLGATPFGYKVAEQFGLRVIPTTAGLVPFTLHKEDKEDFAELSGIAVPAEITAEDGTMFKEALLFTHRGLSGPAVLQISSFWRAGQKVLINLVPNDDVAELLERSREKHPNQSLKNTLAKVLPKRLVEVLIERKELVDKPLKQFNQKELAAIVERLEHWDI
ncbi:NAD(P)/FAD-dependent oxidoreductase, partial [Vibrio parahaemolyticus]|nr:NAD(P)/FAD-dependent oxidoreductase [Vibrio parahaemolyticus]